MKKLLHNRNVLLVLVLLLLILIVVIASQLVDTTPDTLPELPASGQEGIPAAEAALPGSAPPAE